MLLKIILVLSHVRPSGKVSTLEMAEQQKRFLHSHRLKPLYPPWTTYFWMLHSESEVKKLHNHCWAYTPRKPELKDTCTPMFIATSYFLKPQKLESWKAPCAQHVLSCFSNDCLFVTPWTVPLQAPPSVGFPRQDYWSGLPCPSPADLPHPGSNLRLLWLAHWQANSLPLSHQGGHGESQKLMVVLASAEHILKIYSKWDVNVKCKS